MYYYLSEIQRRVRGTTFLCDGDDTIMFVEPRYESDAIKVAKMVADSLCLTVKFENRCEDGRGLLFCQHRLDPDVPVFLPDPVRVWNKLSGAIVKHVTDTTIQNAINRRIQAYIGYKIAYPRMPLIEAFADYYDVSVAPGIASAVVVEREGTGQDGDWSVWGHDYGSLLCTVRY